MLRETTLTATKYLRCKRITIDNPSPTALPTVRFESEEIILLPDGKTVNEDKGIIHGPFNPTESFAILNPDTFEPTGATMTHMELYAIMVSLYKAELDKSEAVGV